MAREGTKGCEFRITVHVVYGEKFVRRAIVL